MDRKMTCKYHANDTQGSPFCPQPLASVKAGDRFSVPSLLLVKTAHRLRAEMSIEKIIYDYFRFRHLAPFCSSTNSPNVEHVTRHREYETEEETQFIQQID